jgi:kynurenine formamidase
MKITKSIKVFPGSPQPSFIPWSNFSQHGFDSEAIFMSTHTGTHMDAPSHFAPGRQSVEKIDVSRFVSSAVLARIPRKANELIERYDVKDLDVRKNEAVVFATGWECKSRAANYMTSNPGLSAGAAKLLVSKKVGAVAIDGPSIDAGSDSKFTAHRILLANNVLVVENLCNLARLKQARFTLIIAPLKLHGSTGSPVRALAMMS